MKIVLLIVVSVIIVLIIGIVARHWQKGRRDLAELDKAVWNVVARLSHGRQFLLKEILKCESIQIIDGWEQRSVWIDAGEFKLFVSKETKRPRVWVKIWRGENFIRVICRGASKLGKAADSLFSSIDQYSKPLPEGFERALQEHVEILREIGASSKVIKNAEQTAEHHGVSIPKQNDPTGEGGAP